MTQSDQCRYSYSGSKNSLLDHAWAPKGEQVRRIIAVVIILLSQIGLTPDDSLGFEEWPLDYKDDYLFNILLFWIFKACFKSTKFFDFLDFSNISEISKFL